MQLNKEWIIKWFFFKNKFWNIVVIEFNENSKFIEFIKKASDKGHLDAMNFYRVLTARGYNDIAKPKECSRYIMEAMKACITMVIFYILELEPNWRQTFEKSWFMKYNGLLSH